MAGKCIFIDDQLFQNACNCGINVTEVCEKAIALAIQGQNFPASEDSAKILLNLAAETIPKTAMSVIQGQYYLDMRDRLKDAHDATMQKYEFVCSFSHANVRILAKALTEYYTSKGKKCSVAGFTREGVDRLFDKAYDLLKNPETQQMFAPILKAISKQF